MEIVDFGKKVLQAIQASDNVAASQLILEFQSMALELQEENYKLRKRIDELENHINLMDDMSFDGKVYWRGEGEDRDGPFCQRCLDAEGRAVRLQLREQPATGYESRWYECHSCQSHIDLQSSERG